MSRLSDEELIQELRDRFAQNKRSLSEYKRLMGELEELNRKLQESERVKSDFLSNIRNEIVNPLTTLLGLSRNLLLFDWPNQESVRSAAALIHKEALNLDFQLKNIFTAAELEAGERVPKVTKVNLIDLFDSVVESLQPWIAEKKIDVMIKNENSSSGKRELPFTTDAEMFRLILANLLNNAVEFSHRKGKVEVQIGLRGEGLHLSVRDYGIGIDGKDQEKIFDRFRQLDSGAGKQHPGHGLGLSVVRDLVEMLGGRITVTSRKGEGALFIVQLPESEEENSGDRILPETNVVFFEEEVTF